MDTKYCEQSNDLSAINIQKFLCKSKNKYFLIDLGILLAQVYSIEKRIKKEKKIVET
jgi:hypothetical protein